ncbi:hypothetical protein FHW68_001668 [Pseudomonas sp. Tn43]|nr:hypothetical protein [Pseudomonas sp. Tn43]
MQPSGLDGVTQALHKIQEAILRPIQLSGHTLHVTGSMGLATYPTDGSDTDTLLSNADAAMYREIFSQVNNRRRGSCPCGDSIVPSRVGIDQAGQFGQGEAQFVLARG